MEFFNKKQDVIEIQLTPYGKSLLSKGAFKPGYYVFSDDGVLYDDKWVTGSAGVEKQSQIEPRIQENTPRVKTQYTKAAAEKKIYNVGWDNWPAAIQNIYDLFEFANLQDFKDNLSKVALTHNDIANEKLLENTLGNKSRLDQFNPAWNVLFYHGLISGSAASYETNDLVRMIPQLNCTISDSAYKLPTPKDGEKPWSKKLPAIKSIAAIFEEPVDEWADFFQSLNMPDGSGEILIAKDFLFLSFEETSVEFDNENFTLEVFEVTEESDQEKTSEVLEKMMFAGASGLQVPPNTICVEHVFEIQADKAVDPEVACYLIGKDRHLKNQNIFVTNTYDCHGPGDDTKITPDPYVNLPKTNVEDVC